MGIASPTPSAPSALKRPPGRLEVHEGQVQMGSEGRGGTPARTAATPVRVPSGQRRRIA